MPAYCQSCGAESVSPLCARCSGGSFANAATADAPREIFAGPAFVVHDELRGVGGWLLFFCISLTILTPLRFGSVAVTALRNLIATPPEDSYSVYRLLFVSAIYATLAALSVTAGFLLWTEDRKGVVLAKVFLALAFVAPTVLDIVLAATGFKMDVIGTILVRAVYPTIWFLYLQSSDRVHATYGK